MLFDFAQLQHIHNDIQSTYAVHTCIYNFDIKYLDAMKDLTSSQPSLSLQNISILQDVIVLYMYVNIIQYLLVKAIEQYKSEISNFNNIAHNCTCTCTCP